MKKITVIGGGLSGLITAIQLIRAQIPVQLFERKKYPFHRVCGEYISNETLPFLKSHDLYPKELNPGVISTLQLTSTNGKSAELALDPGGFGISRYSYDHWLYKKAEAEGVEVHQNTEITGITFQDDQFELHTHQNVYESAFVIGAFGKRSKIDAKMKRSFITKRSPYLGVKYHIRANHPKPLISLHNFQGGYCGLSNVENGISNLCYLSHSSNLKAAGTIKKMEENILFQNPFLKEIFQNSDFLFTQPETIHEISFETKSPVEEHILMCGDAAGMITPLCGNGMAMAIHSSKILCELIISFYKGQIKDRKELERLYSVAWSKQFAQRLWVGRQLQRLFGSSMASNFAVVLGRKVRPLADFLISKTHGYPF